MAALQQGLYCNLYEECAMELAPQVSCSYYA